MLPSDTQQTLQIHLTHRNLIARLTIVCSQGENRRPTVDSNDWSNRGSAITELLIPDVREGWYVIGVYNHNEKQLLSFNIMVNFGNVLMQRMVEAVPLDLIIN